MLKLLIHKNCTMTELYLIYANKFMLHSQSDGGLVCKTLWTGLENLSSQLHRVILSFLKCSPDVRNELLTWFGECLEYNTSRKQLWSNMMQQLMPVEHSHISDGFALNLCSVLLRLCEPFMKPPNNPKLLKIDPTYCAVVSISTTYSVFLICVATKAVEQLYSTSFGLTRSDEKCPKHHFDASFPGFFSTAPLRAKSPSV